jgi:membrane-associated phospholipid phosphatase
VTGIGRATTSRWALAVRMVRRPYRVTFSMVALVSLVPFYIFIAAMMHGRTLHAPAIPLDSRIPLQPAWAIVYGTLYLFLILLPVFVVCGEEHIHRTVLAYLSVWCTAYVCFLAWPTVAPRPPAVPGTGFSAWGLRFLYEADPPYNCFPSLHVAHSFVSAMTTLRVHRRLGCAAVGAALLVGISTLYTKQHYVLDVAAGVLLALVAGAFFLRFDGPQPVPESERRAAPCVALGILGLLLAGVACFWVVYRLTGLA